MAKSELILQDGEELRGVLEGELFAITTSALSNFFLHILKAIIMVFGTKETAHMIVTNRRIVIETRKTSCYVFPSGGTFKTILPQGVASVSYAFMGTLCGCCLKKYVVGISTNSGRSLVMAVKGGKKVASDFANLMLESISR